MVRDSLVGLYLWPPDRSGDDTIFSGIRHSSTFCLEDGYKLYQRRINIEPEEIYLGPKVIVEWSE